MSKIINLREIAEIKNGFAFKSKDFCEEGIPIVKIKNITPPKISIDDAQYVSKEIYEDTKQYELNYNDILISMTGSGVNQMSSAVGKVGRVRYKNKSLQNQRVGKVIVKDESRYNVDFLYYYLSMNKTLEYFVMNSSGSANQANISKDIIERLEVPDFDILDQNRIANILLSLDNKVENNNAIIANLEEQAQTIFKSWFVDFDPFQGEEFINSEFGKIPKSGKAITLDNIADIIMGISPKSETYNNEYLGLPLLNGAADFYEDTLNPTRFTSNPIKVSQKKDWLLCIRGTIGNLASADGKYAIGRGVSAIRSKDDVYRELIYYYIKHNINNLKSNATGSVISGLSKTDLTKIIVFIPNKSKMIEIHNTFSSIQKVQRNMKRENNLLESIRDTLLPKLMSGEIRVEEALEVK